MSDDESDLYEGYSVDSEDQPQGGGGLEGDSTTGDRGLADPLDEGYSPPERYSVLESYGNTPLEEEQGASLDQQLASEIPEPDPYVEAEREAEDLDAPGLDDGEVGDERAGRLVEDDDQDGLASDVGIDGAAASAEEAAVHVVDE